MIKFWATSLKISGDITLVSGDITFDLTLNPPNLLQNGLYVEAPCERAPLFHLQVYEKIGKSVIVVCERNKRALRQMHFTAVTNNRVNVLVLRSIHI